MDVSHNNNLTMNICTYNSKGHGMDRIEYIKYLMSRCDILFIQEHWMYDHDIHTLEQTIGNVNVFGVSAMDSSTLLIGRPHGGCAIVYNKSLNMVISQIDTGNPRICAAKIKITGSLSFLLFNVYMPCDRRNAHANNIQYNPNQYDSVLQDISNICTKFSHIDHILIGGDFNTDVTRTQSIHTVSLNAYCLADDLSCCTRDLNVTEFSYENSVGNRSFLDHFLVSENMIRSVTKLQVIHSGDNLSDHCPVIMSCDIKGMADSVKVGHISYQPKPSWRLATQEHIERYKSQLNVVLSALSIPDAIHCHNSKCSGHSAEIIQYHNDIVQACISCMNDSIPCTKHINA